LFDRKMKKVLKASDPAEVAARSLLAETGGKYAC
jgi:hypothetical protein